MSQTEKKKSSTNKNKSLKIILAVILIIGLIFAGILGFLFYKFNGTRNEIENAINQNSEVYKPVEEKSNQYFDELENILYQSTSTKTVEETDSAISKIKTQKELNLEIIKINEEALAKELKNSSNNEIQEYNKEIETYIQSGKPFYQKTGKILDVTECFLINQQIILKSENEIAGFENIDTSSTQSMIKDLESFKKSISKAKSGIDGAIKCFDGEYEDLKSDELISEFTKLSGLFSQMNGYIDDIILGVKTLDVAKINTASTNIQLLDLEINTINSDAASNSFENKINEYLEEDAKKVDNSLIQIKTIETNLKNKYQISNEK